MWGSTQGKTLTVVSVTMIMVLQWQPGCRRPKEVLFSTATLAHRRRLKTAAEAAAILAADTFEGHEASEQVMMVQNHPQL
jgi:hypothetical protein